MFFVVVAIWKEKKEKYDNNKKFRLTFGILVFSFRWMQQKNIDINEKYANDKQNCIVPQEFNCNFRKIFVPLCNNYRAQIRLTTVIVATHHFESYLRKKHY